jgi:hypothetical protein
MINEMWQLMKDSKTLLYKLVAIFITIMLWLFGYIFSRGKIPPDHPDGNNEEVVIPLWHKEKDD